MTSSPPTVDQLANLRKTIELVLDDPDSWDQGYWITRRSCGTAYCVAGTYAVLVRGAQPHWGLPNGLSTSLVIESGVVSPVDELATRDLGLPYGHQLFADVNSLRRVVELAYLYSGGDVDLLDRYHAVAATRDADWRADQRVVERRDAARFRAEP